MIGVIEKPVLAISKWAPIAAILTGSVLCAQDIHDLNVPAPLPPGSTLVVGFLGGFDRWNDDHRSVRRLALDLGARPRVFAVSISNHRRHLALQLIRRALDANGNGKLDSEERRAARIILYGQSLGGAAAIATARDLDALGIPVLFTVQVDSVGLRDGTIPPNVRAAVNYYQHDRLTIRGQREIRAENPSRTRILGNFGRSYRWIPKDTIQSSWMRRTFGGSHAKMEADSVLWTQIEDSIVDAIEGR
jgi:hypothetical protein